MAYVARCKTSVSDLADQFKILVELRTALQQTVDKIDSVISESRIFKLKEASTRGLLFCEGFMDLVRSVMKIVQVFVWEGPGRGTEEVRVLVVQVIIAVIAPVCTEEEISEGLEMRAILVALILAYQAQIDYIQMLMGDLTGATFNPPIAVLNVTEPQVHVLDFRNTTITTTTTTTTTITTTITTSTTTTTTIITTTTRTTTITTNHYDDCYCYY